MNKITFPLKPAMQGPTVAGLQDAMQLCLDRAAILASDESARRSEQGFTWRGFAKDLLMAVGDAFQVRGY
jgi:hypothetical protein